jgi:hypothetical protein
MGPFDYGTQRVITYTYECNGNRVWGPTGELISAPFDHRAEPVTTFSYDRGPVITAIREPGGHPTPCGDEGSRCPTRETDAGAPGMPTFVIDARGRLIAVVDANGVETRFDSVRDRPWPGRSSADSDVRGRGEDGR